MRSKTCCGDSARRLVVGLHKLIDNSLIVLVRQLAPEWKAVLERDISVPSTYWPHEPHVRLGRVNVAAGDDG